MPTPTIVFPHSVHADFVRQVIRNLGIDCSSNTQVVIKQNSVAGADDGASIMQAAADITIDITISGVNGLDAGVEAPSTWYYVYLICNPSTGSVQGLLSLSPTSPALPAGYAQKRLIGAARNSAGGNFVWFRQRNRFVKYSSFIGVLTNGSSAAWAAVSLLATVPSVAETVTLYNESSRADVDATIRRSSIGYDGVNASFKILSYGGAYNFFNSSECTLPWTSSSTSFYYFSETATVLLSSWVSGYALDL